MAIIDYASPVPIFQFLDNSGNIVPGGKLFTYAAGTNTKQSTFTDATGATANSNPAIADANGRVSVFLTPGTPYRLVWSPANDTDPPTNSFWDVDGIVATATSSTIIGGQTTLLNNLYYDDPNYRYTADGFASMLQMDSTGNISYYTAPSGVAGNVATLTKRWETTIANLMSLGVAPSAWGAALTAFDVGSLGALSGDGATLFEMLFNAYNDGTNYKYKEDGFAGALRLTSTGAFQFHSAPSGSANANITFTQRFQITQAGAVSGTGIGTMAAVNSPAPVANGGTGATTQAQAKVNLQFGGPSFYDMTTVSANTPVDGVNNNNSTGKPMEVSVEATGNSGSGTLSLQIGPNTGAYVTVASRAANYSPDTERATLKAIVPPGWYWKVVAGSWTITGGSILHG